MVQMVCCLEEAFVVKMQALGPGSEAVLHMCGELSQSYNTLAMRKVEQDSFDEAYELLKKAEVGRPTGSRVSTALHHSDFCLSGPGRALSQHL